MKGDICSHLLLLQGMVSLKCCTSFPLEEGSEQGWAVSSIRAGSQCYFQACYPSGFGRLDQLHWLNYYEHVSLSWHSGFAVLHKKAKALSKWHLCLGCFYNLSSWGPQKTPQEIQITCDLPALSTSADLCISWKSTIHTCSPCNERHVKKSAKLLQLPSK